MGLLSIRHLSVLGQHGKLTPVEVDGLEIPWAGMWLVLGQNFSGRTDFLRALSGELQDNHMLGTELDVSWVGFPKAWSAVYGPADDAVYLGASPANLISGLAETVQEEIGLHARCASIRANGLAPDRLQHWIEQLALAPLVSRDPFSLSGGEQASVGLISALALARPVLCVDGLMAQLDQVARAAAYGVLAEYAGRYGIVLVAEHDYDLAVEIASGVILMDSGTIVSSGDMSVVCRSREAARLDCLPTTARYARDLSRESHGDKLPITANEFSDWIRTKYGF